MSQNLAKKIFAVGTAGATLLMSMAPLSAFAAAHSAGTNVKSSDGTVWMITTDGQRRAYTSAGAFLSYGFNSFSSVVGANADDLALPAGSFIPPQDGKVICSDRGADKGTCYLITGAMKAGFTSASVFTGLGFSFSRVQQGDVSWMNSTSNIDNTTAAHRPGVLVNDSGTVKLVGNSGVLGIPDLATFNSWGYSFADVVPANAADKALSMSGVMATRQPGQLSPTAITGGGGCGTNCPPPPTGSALSVSLSSMTPAPGNVATGAAFIPFTAVNFSAGSNPVTVTQVKVTRTGLSSDSSLNNAYLFDGATMLAQTSSFQNGVATFVNSAGIFTVPANSTKTVWVKADIASGSSNGATYMFGINQASDVLSNASSVTGSFPIMGNGQVSSTVSSPSLSTLTANSVSVGTSVNAGTLGLLAGQFSLQSANSTVAVKSITLTLVGSASPSAFQNVKLVANGTQVGTTMAVFPSNGVGVFDLSANPLMISTGTTAQVQIKADVTGGVNRNFLFSIQRNYDIQAFDQTYNVGILTTAGSSFPIQQGTNISILAGSLTITKDATSKTGTVPTSATNVKLATFKFTANGEDMKVLSLPISISVAATATVVLNNIKLSDDTGYGIGTSVTTAQTVSTASSYTNTFGSSSNLNYVIPANTTRLVSIVADINSAAGTSPALTASLSAGSSNLQGVTSVASSSSGAASGNSLTVSSTSLSATLNSGLSSPVKVVPNATNQKIASFSLNAGGGDAVNVTTITITAASASVTGNFQNITMKQGTTQIGTVQTVPTNSSAYSFSPSTVINIPAGGTVVVDVYADVLSSATANLFINQALFTLTTVTAQLATSGATASSISSVTGQGITVAGNGAITISKDTSSPTSRQVAMSQQGVNFGVIKFKETTNNEGVVLTDITVTATATAGTTLSGSASDSISSVKNFVLMGSDGSTLPTKASWTTGNGGTGTQTYTITWNNVNVVVPANGQVLMTVKADTNDWNNGAASNSTWVFGIALAGSVTLKGQQSNASITPTLTTNAASNTTTVLRTTIGFTSVGSNSQATVNPVGIPSSGEVVGIYRVAAGSADNLTLTSLTLQQGGTAPTGVAVTYYVYDASVNANAAPVGTATLTGTTAGAITLNLNSASTSSGVEVTKGTTKDLIIKADTNNFNTGSSGSNKTYSLTLTTWAWKDGTDTPNTGGLGASGDQGTVPAVSSTGAARTY